MMPESTFPDGWLRDTPESWTPLPWMCGNDLPWARHHPDLSSQYREDGREIAGWGVFRRFDQRLVLTDPHGTGVSNWRFPRWLYPDGNKLPLTYHPDPKRWRRDANHAYLRSVGRGREFVLDLAHYPEATEWLSDLVSSLGSDTGS